jgi:hypothetical protein
MEVNDKCIPGHFNPGEIGGGGVNGVHRVGWCFVLKVHVDECGEQKIYCPCHNFGST